MKKSFRVGIQALRWLSYPWPWIGSAKSLSAINRDHCLRYYHLQRRGEIQSRAEGTLHQPFVVSRGRP